LLIKEESIRIPLGGLQTDIKELVARIEDLNKHIKQSADDLDEASLMITIPKCFNSNLNI